MNRFKPSAAGKGDQYRPYDKALYDENFDKLKLTRKKDCKHTDSRECEYPQCKCGISEDLYGN